MDVSGNRARVEELLRKRGISLSTKGYTKDEFVDIVVREGLDTLKRIEFNNDNISDNMAVVNRTSDGYSLIITDEKGTRIVNESHPTEEEALGSLVMYLRNMLKYSSSEKKTTEDSFRIK